MKVVYVAGWMRSGTTLTAELLGAQPGALAVGELSGLWSDIARNSSCACGVPIRSCALWGEALAAIDARGLQTRSFDAMAEIGRGALRTRRWRELRNSALQRKLPTGWAEEREFATATRGLLEAALELSGAEYVVDSSKLAPWVFFHAMSGADLRLVHIVRDPRGVVASALRTRVRSVEDIGVVPPGSSLLRSSLDWSWANLSVQLCGEVAQSRIRLEYEDLVADLAGATRWLALAVGVSFDPNTVCENMFVPQRTSHLAVGNPRRLAAGPRQVEADLRWQVELSRRQELEVLALTAPARAALAWGERRADSRSQPD